MLLILFELFAMLKGKLSMKFIYHCNEQLYDKKIIIIKDRSLNARGFE